jgi:hypothetical protein
MKAAQQAFLAYVIRLDSQGGDPRMGPYSRVSGLEAYEAVPSVYRSRSRTQVHPRSGSLRTREAPDPPA